MKALRNIALFLFVSAGCYTQTQQTQPTTAEINFFRFMLMSIGSVDHGVKGRFRLSVHGFVLQ